MQQSPRNPFNPLDFPLCLTAPLQVEALSWYEHIPFAMTLVQLLSPRIIVELGVHSGDSYLAFCQAVAATGARTAVYGVDTWRGDSHASFYGPEVLAKLRRHHDTIYGSFSRLMQSTFDEAAGHFADGSVDLLHIDGFHSYEAVLHDWQTWRPKLSARGVALLHDTNVRERDFGVWRLWDELVVQYPHLHFTHGHGLGVLAVGADAPALLQPMLAADAQQRATLQSFFFKLGHSIKLSKDKATLEAQVAELTQATEEARAEIERREAEARRLLGVQEAETRRLQDLLGVQEAETRRLQDLLGVQEAETRRLQDLLGVQEAETRRLEIELADKGAHVTALLSSTSWRVTAPLRWIQSRLLGFAHRG